MRLLLFFHLLFFLFIIEIISCDYSTASIELLLNFPPGFELLDSIYFQQTKKSPQYRLEMPCRNGDVVCFTYFKNDFPVLLKLPRTENFPLLLYPPGGFKPAGAVYPWLLSDENTFHLNQGWIAEAFFKLYESDALKLVNFDKVMDCYQRKCLDIEGGASICFDQEKLLRDLSQMRINSYSFRERDFALYELPKEVSRESFEEALFSDLLFSPRFDKEEGGYWLPEGAYFYLLQNEKTIYYLSVDIKKQPAIAQMSCRLSFQ